MLVRILGTTGLRFFLCGVFFSGITDFFPEFFAPIVARSLQCWDRAFSQLKSPIGDFNCKRKSNFGGHACGNFGGHRLEIFFVRCLFLRNSGLRVSGLASRRVSGTTRGSSLQLVFEGREGCVFFGGLTSVSVQDSGAERRLGGGQPPSSTPSSTPSNPSANSTTNAGPSSCTSANSKPSSAWKSFAAAPST
jgi:hypothetical protein